MKDLFALISRTADGVCAVDREQRIVFWNDAAAALLGFRAQEVLGRFCHEVIAGRDESGRLVCHAQCAVIMTALRTEVVPPQDLLVRTKPGQELWLNVRTIVVPYQWWDLLVFVHLFHDVSRAQESEGFVQQLHAAAGKPSVPRGTEPLSRPRLPPRSKALTDREREVLRLLAAGARTKTIAEQLFLSPTTVRNHIQNILAKLHVHSRLEAVILAIRSRLV